MLSSGGFIFPESEEVMPAKLVPLSPQAAPRPRETVALLLDWFAGAARDLPWRRERSPWRTLVSEIMLQQTRVSTVIPYFERFMALYPEPALFAAADDDAVLRIWAGLGYYRRGRMLRDAARAIVDAHGGRLPADAGRLRGLPGVGPYTAGAVASIAFGLPEPAVDGNVTRVLARLLLIREEASRPGPRGAIERYARDLVGAGPPGAVVEALMELGALLCTPDSPACSACPLSAPCLAREAGCARDLPVRPAVRAKRESRHVVLLAQVPDGRYVVERRPAEGLLAGQWGFPQAPADPGAAEELAAALLGSSAPPTRTVARHVHVFTHAVWRLSAHALPLPAPPPDSPGRALAAEDELPGLPLMTPHLRLLAALRTARSGKGVRR